jgi:predicted transcriptional regulator
MLAKIEEAEKRADEAETKSQEQGSVLAKKDLEVQDLQTKTHHLEDELAKMNERLAEMDDLKARLREAESGDRAREMERLTSEYERVKANHDRMSQELHEAKTTMAAIQHRIDGYLGLMRGTEKTMAFLMVEETGEMTIKKIASSLGISPAGVRKWAQDFEKLGIALIVDDKKIVLAAPPKPEIEDEAE